VIDGEINLIRRYRMKATFVAGLLSGAFHSRREKDHFSFMV